MPGIKTTLRKIIKAILPYGLIYIYRYIKNTNYCPICNKRSYFIPFGIVPRPKAQCSICGSLERHRFLWAVLKKRNIINFSSIILHIAAEPCLQKKISEKIRGEGKYLTADLYNPNAMIKMDITNIKYLDETFDVIICNHVLEHVIDDRKAIDEFKRVIKKSGVVILMIPIGREKTEEDFSIDTPEGRLKAYGQADHVRACGKDYIERIRSSGFNVEIINQKILKPALIKKISLINDEVFLCTK